MARPDLSLVPDFFHNYINQVPGNDLKAIFKKETPVFIQFIESIPADKRDYRYATGKWTIREVLQHLIDAERIFTYRALCFARKDATVLPGFDENSYVEKSKASSRDWNELVEEFKAVRKASEYMFGSFDDEQLNSIGSTGKGTITVIALGYIVAGHTIHHKKITEERYL